jgi:hypothetical protein
MGTLSAERVIAINSQVQSCSENVKNGGIDRPEGPGNPDLKDK